MHGVKQVADQQMQGIGIKASTGWATRSRRGSPIFRISCTAIKQLLQSVFIKHNNPEFPGFVELAASLRAG